MEAIVVLARIGVRVGLIALVVLLLRRAAPDPGALAAALDDPPGRVRQEGLDVVVADAAGAIGWLVLLWAAVGVLLMGAARLPGAAGRIAEVAAGRAVPAGMRRLVTVGLGLTLTAATTDTALAATPEKTAAAPQAAARTRLLTECAWPELPGGRRVLWPPGTADLKPSPRTAAALHRERSQPGRRPVDWPLEGPDREPSPPGVHWPPETGAPPAVAVDWPLDPAGEGARPRAHGSQPERRVVVSAGDTLWSIAARRLGPGASAAEVAASWPRWYEANRAVIGPDPARLRPGLLLRVPGAP